MKGKSVKGIFPKLGVVSLAVFFILIFQGMLQAHSPTGWNAPTKEKRAKNPIANTPESRNRGRVTYLEKCALCHGSKGDGRGEAGRALNPRPGDFTDRHMMKKMTDGEIFWKITTGKGPMPSYQKELKDEERWDLVNYLRSFANSR